jgi:hypothetical protein
MLSAVTRAGEDGVLLRFTYKEGQSLTYKVVASATETVQLSKGLRLADGSTQRTSDGTFESTCTFVVRKVEANGKVATLESTESVDRVTSKGILIEAFKKKAVGARETFTSEVNDLGFQHRDGAAQDAPEMAKLGSLSIAGFPEKPVKVGDSWELPFPKTAESDIAKVEAKLRTKLVKEEVIDGKPVLFLSSEGSFSVEVDLTEQVKDGPGIFKGQKVLSKGTFILTNESSIEKATGCLLKSTYTMKGKATMTLPERQMDFVTNTATTFVITLQ